MRRATCRTRERWTLTRQNDDEIDPDASVSAGKAQGQVESLVPTEPDPRHAHPFPLRDCLSRHL